MVNICQCPYQLQVRGSSCLELGGCSEGFRGLALGSGGKLGLGDVQCVPWVRERGSGSMCALYAL